MSNPDDPSSWVAKADSDLLYAVTFRYPGSARDPTEPEGREAAAAAQRVYDAVRATLTPPTKP